MFIEVAERESLSAAARQLCVSAPTVTRVLNDFEKELGVLLLHRTTRAVTLTEPGQIFLKEARRIVDLYRDATDLLRGAHRAPTGLLRLTAPILFGQYYVLPVLTQFLEQHQETQVEAIFLDRNVNLVEEGFDLAVRIGSLPDSSMMATRVGSVRRVVCGHPEYLQTYGIPTTPDDLREHQLISATPIGPSHEWCFKNNKHFKVKSRIFLSSMRAAIDAAKSGFGLTQVLSYQIEPDILSGTLQIVLTDFEVEPLPVHIIHAEGREASAKVRVFVEMARAAIGQRLEKQCY